MSEERLFELTNKVAIVTGGMRGLGYATAKAFASFGANLVIADVATENRERIKKEFESLDKKLCIMRVDVSNSKEVNKMVKDTLYKLGRIDILVNNAGTTKRGPAETMLESDWDRLIAVNLKGTFLCSQAVGREMIRQRKGKIINIASTAGQVGLPNTLPYCASKGGVIQITRALAVEWAKYNINVNAIAPTVFETPLTRPLLHGDKEFYNYIIERIPMGRVGQPKDLIGAAVFLASDASNMVTGHVLNVDGGWLAA